MIGPEQEQAQAPDGESFGDSVAFAFGAREHDLYGSARLGLVAGVPTLASGLGMLFAGGELASMQADGGIELERADWSHLTAGDVEATILEPLRAWTVRYDGEDGGFDLRFDALGDPAELGEDTVAATAAGLRGYEQICRVTGTVRRGERRWQVDCRGQRGHQWGAPDWERIELARTVAVWLPAGDGVVLAAVRPRDAAGHDAEATSAFLVERRACVAIEEPRLSTAVDGEGRQRRAGMELWLGEEGEHGPRRLAGEAVCGTTLDLGRLRLDCAFFHWRGEGREGVGRYDVLRRA